MDDSVPAPPLLIEFPADDPARARRFWEGVLGVALLPRSEAQGEGWQAGDPGAAGSGPARGAIGVHARGRGPGDTGALPYLGVPDLPAALERVVALGGEVIHPGERWAICRDSEGSPFALSAAGG